MFEIEFEFSNIASIIRSDNKEEGFSFYFTYVIIFIDRMTILEQKDCDERDLECVCGVFYVTSFVISFK